MLKKFNSIIQDQPIIFNEDVYLFLDSGKVLTGRHGEKLIKNVFDLIDLNEFLFVRENMFFAGLHPILLVESTLGPILIDVSLFGAYRLFIAVIPHFSREEMLALAKDELKSIVKPSPKMKSILLECEYDVTIEERHREFVERLINTHRGAYYYRVHGKTNGELSMFMSEIAYDYSVFCGCNLELTVNGVGLFEMQNELCVDSYIFALTSLLFLARNYSKSRRAKLDIFFDEMGVYFEFGFEICEDYLSLSLLQEAAELKNFKFRSFSRLFDCDFYKSDRVFAVRGYPWFKHPNSANIKQPKIEFIYNL